MFSDILVVEKCLPHSPIISLHDKVVKIVHKGHLGFVNTTMFLCSKVWFKGADLLVENEVKECLACRAAIYLHDKEPFLMSNLRNGPRKEVKVDFYGALPPSGDN